jgi:WD40 repeat protein
MMFHPQEKPFYRLPVSLLLWLLASLLLSGCTGQATNPPPTNSPATDLPGPSTPGVLVVSATPQALLSEIDQANQALPPPVIEATPSPTPTRAPGAGPVLNNPLPALDTLPTPAADPTTARQLSWLTGQNRTPEGKPEPLRAMAFSPDRRLLVLADRLDTWLVETETGKLIQTIRGGANSLAWSPDGLLMASGGLNGVIMVWRWDKPTAKFRNGPNRLASSSLAEAFGDTVEVAFSPDSKNLAGFTSDGTISVYNTDTGQLQQSFISDFAGYLSWSPDGKRLADEFLGLHSLGSGQTAEPSYEIGIGGDGPQGISWSPDGKLLAVSGDAFELLLVEAPPEAPAGQIQSGVTTIQTRVSLRSNNTTNSTGQSYTVMPHLTEGRRVAWSPDSRWVAVANVPEAGKISIWDRTGNFLQTIAADQGPLRTLVWQEDGLVVSAGADGVARFWQLSHPPAG